MGNNAVRIVVLALLLGGCGGGADPVTAPTAAASAQPAADATGEPAAAVTGEPAGDGRGAGAVEERGLPGLGSTRAAWESTHRQAVGFAQGAAFGPLLDGNQPTYAAVYGDDRILSYIFHAPTELSDDEVLAVVEATELPSDAVAVTTVDCPDGPVTHYDSALLADAVDGARGAYVAIDRFDHVSVALGVSFTDDPGC